MYFYDWSWQLLKEPLLPIREIMRACVQEIFYKKNHLKSVYISNEHFVSYQYTWKIYVKQLKFR